MINLSDNARKELESFFSDKPKSGIRVYLAPGGWRGPRLALALDEPTDDDTVMEIDNFTFCVSKDLLAEVEGINIDLSYMGFTVDPVKPLAQAGGSACGSCGTGGSCSI